MDNLKKIIEVTDVKKNFKVYNDRGVTLKDRILSFGKSKHEKREVLKGISFDVDKGEAIGLVGKNGCGKSTTLKLLTKIIYPNEGSVKLNGRVSSLLELGAGFHPDMSGLENIYMNASVFGLSRREIDKRLHRIIEFSELREYIDNPVRTYSSGMYMRLAFSVAINVDADILLIDEILAVGDISFQKKCFERLKDIKMNGTTIVIVSHSLDQIEKICDRSIWIDNGLIREQGNPSIVHKKYLEMMEFERLERFQQEVQNEMHESFSDKNNAIESFKKNTEKIDSEASKEEQLNSELDSKKKDYNILYNLKNNYICSTNEKMISVGGDTLEFTEFYLTNAVGEEKLFFEVGECINIYISYDLKKVEKKGTIGLLIYRDDGLYCYGSTTFIENEKVISFTTKGLLHVEINDVNLLPGRYYFTITAHDEEAKEYHTVQMVTFFQLYSNKDDQGVVRLKSKWEIL